MVNKGPQFSLAGALHIVEAWQLTEPCKEIEVTKRVLTTGVLGEYLQYHQDHNDDNIRITLIIALLQSHTPI